jgi:hypothetical protein
LLNVKLAKVNNIKFDEQTLINDKRIAKFSVPIGIFGISIPGSVHVTLKSALELNIELEKNVDFLLSYSKHINFNVPFEYNNKVLTTPNFNSIKNVSENLYLDDSSFWQLTQFPKLGSVLTLTPILTVKL